MIMHDGTGVRLVKSSELSNIQYLSPGLKKHNSCVISFANSPSIEHVDVHLRYQGNHVNLAGTLQALNYRHKEIIEN